MMKRIGTLMLSGGLIVLPSLARAEAAYSGGAVAGATVETGSPPTSAPTGVPPAPPAQTPAPPTRASPAVPSGQWVYTSQYGWIWIPYSNAYSYVPHDGYGEPWLYVYYPVYGWIWLSAPWIWGIGPWPWFDVWGPTHFWWYTAGWWRQPWRWRYAPTSGVGYRGPVVSPSPYRWNRAGAVSPAPMRGGFGGRVYGGQVTGHGRGWRR